jgi:hypothetical protein
MQVQLAKVGEGSDEAGKALARLNIPTNDFIGLKPDEQFEKVAVAISNITDPAERTAAAVGLFGKSGAELLPVLVSTGTELAKVSAQFEGIGGAVSADAIGKVDDLGDSFAALKLGVTSLTTELLSTLAPALTEVTLGVTHFVAGLRLIDGVGSNAIVNVGNRIRDLQKRLETLEKFQGFPRIFSGGRDSAVVEIIKVRNELDRLLATERELLGLNASPLVKIAPLDTSLIQAPSISDPDALSVGEKRRGALGADNPVVASAIAEKDLLLEINQEKLDELLRQETDASVARVRVSGDTQATMLDMVEAFSGQIINWARFRADFEENATLATVGLVGQALSATFQKNKGLQIAMATISTISGVARALADYPYPYSLIIGGAVALSGFAQVAKIKATNYNASGAVSGGGIGSISGGSVGSASASASPVSAPPAPKQRGVAQIIINGPITGEQSMRWLVDRLRENIGDFDLVLNRVGG